MSPPLIEKYPLGIQFLHSMLLPELQPVHVAPLGPLDPNRYGKDGGAPMGTGLTVGQY